jgi:hypothetical protein
VGVKPSTTAPERILAFGGFGSGKTKGYCDIAQMYRQTNTPGTFHVLSTVGQVARVSLGYPQTDIDPGWDTNVTVHEVRDWPSLAAATKEIRSIAGADDWIVIDELGKPWEWCGRYYDETRPGYRADGGTDPFALEVIPERDYKAWVQIKNVYYRWINSIALDQQWHTYACAHEDALRVEGGWQDSDEAIATYKYIGMRAVTEKTAPYIFQTILWMRRAGASQWVATTVKDPSREYLTSTPLASFPMTYLLGPAQWTL